MTRLRRLYARLTHRLRPSVRRNVTATLSLIGDGR